MPIRPSSKSVMARQSPTQATAQRDMQSSAPRVVGLQISNGGVPKLPVKTAVVTPLGLQGDAQREKKFHGGPERALCLYAMEILERLRAEGHPIVPGGAGENITVGGLDWREVVPGRRFRLGDEVIIEIASYTTPCLNIAACFADGDFTRISQKLHPGQSRVYARVLQTGELCVGDAVAEIESPAGEKQDAV